MDETKKDVKCILEEWNLGHLYTTFVDNSIDYEAFCLLTEDHIKELIPKLGDRIKFLKKFKIFHLEINPPIIINLPQTEVIFEPSKNLIQPLEHGSDASFSTYETGSPLPFLTDFVEDVPLEIVPVPPKAHNAFSDKNFEEIALEPMTYNFDLKTFLESSCEGREILHATGKFTPTIRNKLTDLIIKNELKTEESLIATARFVQLARLIKQLFPLENICTYYSPYVTDAKGNYRRTARGKLFDKYHNRRRALRAAGLLPDRKLQEISENKPVLSEEVLEICSWLENCFSPWTDVVEKWEATFWARKEILSSDVAIEQYFNRFIALKQPLGYTLIELDFKKQFEGYESKLFLTLPQLIPKILLKARQSKDQNIQKLLEENDAVENQDHEHALALMCLPYLFAKTVLVKPKANKKIQWRPSKLEVQESFLVHVKTAAEVQPFLERRRKKYIDLKETCQPLLILIGEKLNNYEVLLSINNILYQIGNLMRSTDVIFKFFHVLQLKYPVECEYIWGFIQKHIYELKTPWDKSQTVVEQFISDLAQD